MTGPKLLILEFNELCPPLLEKWMAAGELPNFKKLHDTSQVFLTVADAEPPALEPWIQWYSMHTGLSYDQHRVFRLTDGPRAKHTDVWSVLRDAGYSTGNCSSMNARGYSAKGSFFVPDPWCTTERADPDELNVFYDFVATMVQEYSNRDNKLSPATAVRFLWFMLRHGMKIGTALDIVHQLAQERLQDRSRSYRRVVVLDWLQRDLFTHYYKKFKPDFATFFLNSTAHLQHTYWRHMDPDAFQNKPSEADLKRYKDAILFGYQNMDRLVGDFMALADREGTTLALATALSQQPFLKYEGIGGQHFYRPRRIEEFVRQQLKLDPARIEPVMTHQYQLRFKDEDACDQAKLVLSKVNYEGNPVFYIDTKADHSLYIGCQLRTEIPQDAKLEWTEGNTARSANFYDVLYMIDATKSGRHHPEGVFWIRTGEHRVASERIFVLDIFPTILNLYGVEPPRELAPQLHGQVINLRTVPALSAAAE